MPQEISTENKRSPNTEHSEIKVNVIRASGARSQHLCAQASGICVRIDGHRRRVEIAVSAESLLEILEQLESENLADGDEEFNVRVGRRRQGRSLSQLLKEASDPSLSKEERELKLGRARSAIQNQLVREKLERVEGIHKELKTISLDTKMSDADKKIAVEGVLTKALNNGLISENEHQTFLHVLSQPEGIDKVIKLFGAKLNSLQTELRTTAILLRNHVEDIEVTPTKITSHSVLVAGDPGIRTTNALVPAPIAAQTTSYISVLSSIDEAPQRKKYTQILLESLEELCEVKRKAIEKEKELDAIEEEQDRKLEMARIKEVFLELQGQIPGLRISDIQIVLASIENMSHSGLRQLVLNMKNMFGGQSDSDKD